MSLCNRAQVKAFLEIETADTAYDDLIDAIVEEVSGQCAAEAGRIANGMPCLERTTTTLLFSPEPATRDLWLPAYPVVEIGEIKEAYYGGFDDADALVENTDYQLDAARGRLIRIGNWLAGDLCVRVADLVGGYTRCAAWVSGTAYSAGDTVHYAGAVYVCSDDVTGSTSPAADDDHWTVQTGQTPLPDEVRGAAIQQASFNFQRRKSLGLAGQSVQGASMQIYGRDELLPNVRQVIRRYNRMVG